MQNVDKLVKFAQDEMRKDAGVNGDAQRIEQLVWMLFLKIYDTKEKDWELKYDNYISPIKEEYRWRNWAHDKNDGSAKTGQQLVDFINNELFPSLASIEINEKDSMRKKIVRAAFEDNKNYMKDGVILRTLLNTIDEIDLNNDADYDTLGDIYETILKDLQEKNSGEFYTPRALTDFAAKALQPNLNDKIADLATGTGGFLISAANFLKRERKIESSKDKENFNKAFFGIEKKGLPFLLCVTNMLLHGVEEPRIYHANSFEVNTRELDDMEKFDLILMNPPFGGKESDSILRNFPIEYRSKETADLFMYLIMERLKDTGRAAVVLPDGFLFSEDQQTKTNIKKKLLEEFNLHSIIRFPNSVFAPYTSIATNILFFEKGKKTENIWYYFINMPEGYKAFSKTKRIKLEHISHILDLMKTREEVEDEKGTSKLVSVEEIIANNYNLDIKLQKETSETEVIQDPEEYINSKIEKTSKLQKNIETKLNDILELIRGK